VPLAGHSTKFYPEQRTSKHEHSNCALGLKQTAGMAKPKLVKKIKRSTTLDYFVDHAAYPHAVIHVQWNAQDSVGVGRYVLITGNTIDVCGAKIKGEFQAFTQSC
jgi:hypothetical protein